jgi:hypothetical protein
LFLGSSCLSLPSVGIIGGHHHTWYHQKSYFRTGRTLKNNAALEVGAQAEEHLLSKHEALRKALYHLNNFTRLFLCWVFSK